MSPIVLLLLIPVQDDRPLKMQAIIPIALKNDEKLRHAERKANKKKNDKQNQTFCDDGSSFSGMGVRLNDGKKMSSQRPWGKGSQN